MRKTSKIFVQGRFSGGMGGPCMCPDPRSRSAVTLPWLQHLGPGIFCRITEVQAGGLQVVEFVQRWVLLGVYVKDRSLSPSGHGGGFKRTGLDRSKVSGLDGNSSQRLRSTWLFLGPRSRTLCYSHVSTCSNPMNEERYSLHFTGEKTGRRGPETGPGHITSEWLHPFCFYVTSCPDQWDTEHPLPISHRSVGGGEPADLGHVLRAAVTLPQPHLLQHPAGSAVPGDAKMSSSTPTVQTRCPHDAGSHRCHTPLYPAVLRNAVHRPPC